MATRTYHTTHPWITFELELRRVPWDFCLLTGEAIIPSNSSRASRLPPEPARLAALYAVKGAHQRARAMEEEQPQRGGLPAAHRRAEAAAVEGVPRRRDRQRRRPPPTACSRPSPPARLPPLTPEQITDLNRQLLPGAPLRRRGDPRPPPAAARSASPTTAARPAEDLEELLARLCDWLGRPQVPHDRLAPAGRRPLDGGDPQGRPRPRVPDVDLPVRRRQRPTARLVGFESSSPPASRIRPPTCWPSTTTRPAASSTASSSTPAASAAT